MMTESGQSHRARLRAIAIRVMRERGLDPEFSADALAEVASLKAAPRTTDETVRDLRTLPCASASPRSMSTAASSISSGTD